jgi:hypothetical protein
VSVKIVIVDKSAFALTLVLTLSSLSHFIYPIRVTRFAELRCMLASILIVGKRTQHPTLMQSV